MSDLRLACRQFVQRPLFSAAAVLTLAVGIGLNAVVFSGVNALFLKGNAGSHLEGAVWVLATGAGDGSAAISLAELERFTRATRGALRAAALGRMPLAWQRPGASETIWSQLVSADYFQLLEVQPIAGRLPTPTRSTDAPEAIVGERFWRQRLDGSPIGTVRLTLNGVDHAVVGVVSERFRGPSGTFAPDVWAPLERWQALALPAALNANDRRWLTMIGRIDHASSLAEVATRVSTAAADMAREWPSTHGQRGAGVAPMRDGHPALRTFTRLALMAMAATGIVLLLACFNVASLLLARGVERRREIGIRAALGAGRGRIVRQLVAEGLVLAMASGIVALLLAAWSQQLLAAFALPSPIPQRIDLSLDGRSVAFVTLLIIVAGVLPGLAPALQAAKVDLVSALAARALGGHRPSRGRRVLLAAQVTGSTVFLTGAVLFVQSTTRLASVDPGFEAANAIVIEIEPALQGYDATRARLLVDRAAARLHAMPDVIDVAIADRIPLYVGFARMTPHATEPGRCATDACATAATYAVGGGFFRTMAIPLVAGTELDATRGAASAAGGVARVVVSETLARSRWPGRSPIGETLYLGRDGRPHLVTGVARDTSHRSLVETAPAPALYVPLGDDTFAGAVTIVARTRREPGALILEAAEVLHQVDPAVPPRSIKRMAERIEGTLWPARTATAFFAVCGALALLLAVAGLTAMVMHGVMQRRRELGIRLAIGATQGTIMREVLRDSATLVAPGTIAGLLIAGACAHTARAVFGDLDVTNPLTYLVVATVQIGIALLACLAPAHRAACVDPLISLRAD